MNADPERGFLRAYGALIALYPASFSDMTRRPCDGEVFTACCALVGCAAR